VARVTTPQAEPAAVVECIDCAALPPAIAIVGGVEGARSGVDYRPTKRRPIAAGCGPRSRRCAAHKRAHENARKQAESDARSRKRSGLDEDTRQEVLDEQGRVCAGCKRPGVGRAKHQRRNLAADHDHDQAAEHEHDDDVACLDCLRGFLCSTCNRRILGTLRGLLRSDAAVAACLTNLAAYLNDPPAARVRRRRTAQPERTAA
jgi:hypothetical protein